MDPAMPAWDKVCLNSHFAKKQINKWGKYRINSWSQLLSWSYFQGIRLCLYPHKHGLLEARHSPTPHISAPPTLVFTMFGSLTEA